MATPSLDQQTAGTSILSVLLTDDTQRGKPRSGEKPFLDVEWKRVPWLPESSPPRYRVRVALTKEDDGGFSAVCPELPGAVSQGSTIDQALERMEEAVTALLSSYAELGEQVPWKSAGDAELAPESIERWIVVSG